MPFVKQECRAENHVSCSVGDLCFKAYKPIIEAWRKEPRWTTAHNEFKRIFGTNDEQTATILAYMVFFNMHVIDYEFDKQDEHGDI